MSTNSIRLNIKYTKVQSVVENGDTLVTDIDFDKICRNCLTQNQINPIFQLNYDGQSFSTILESCTSLVIKEHDGLPQNICNDCVCKTLNMYTYLLQCQQLELMFKSILKAREKNQAIQSEDDDDVEIIYIEHEIDTDSAECTEQTSIDNTKQLKKSGHLKESITESLIHRKTNQQTSGLPYNCDTCNVTYKTQEEVTAYQKLVNNHEPREYRCTVCSGLFSENHQVKLHMRSHAKEKPHVCKHCSMRFRFSSNLKRHMKTHTGEKCYICEFCGKGYIQGIHLKTHMRTHTKETPYMCNYCGKRYTHSSSLKTHILVHHSSTAERRTRTKTQRSISEKQDIEHEQKFECTTCNKTFSSQGALRTHLLSHGEKKQLCSMCGKKFYSQGALQLHFRIHTGVKPYTCKICCKSFTYSHHLKIHLLTHTGGRPFTCKVCDKAFKQSNHLKYHMRIHNEERPYACTCCGKSFTLKSNLTVHLRIHTGEMPYVCNVCEKGFYDSSSLKKHKRKHWENVPKSSYKVDDVKSDQK